MQLVEHKLGLSLERGSKEVVQILFIFLVDARDGDGAAIAGWAGARGHALLRISAAVCHSRTRVTALIDHLNRIPVLERSMLTRESGKPLVRVADDLLVDAVFVVFLSLRIEEEVETGKVAEAHVLGQAGALLLPERCKELVVKVADLALSDRGKRVNRVKPSVELRVSIEMVRARSGERFSVLNVPDDLHESGSFGHHINVGAAEIVNIGSESVGCHVTAILEGRVSVWSERFEHEIASVEARGCNDSIY